MNLRNLSLLPFLCCPALADAAPAARLSCTVESAANESTGEPVPAEGHVFQHRLTDLKAEGERYTRSETIETPDSRSELSHAIDRASGRFETVAIQTRHDLGEEHAIRMNGTCRPATTP